MNKNFVNIITNPFMQIIIIIIFLILIFAILLRFKKNNTREYFSDLALPAAAPIVLAPSAPSSPCSVSAPSPIPPKLGSGINVDKIENAKNIQIYKIFSDISIKDILIKYFEVQYNIFKNNIQNNNELTILFNNKNILISDFIDKYLSMIQTINIPEYDNFLKETFESDEINGQLMLNDFNVLKKIYGSILYVSYLFQPEYYNKIIALKPNYYSIVLKKFNVNYEEIGFFCNKIYSYLQKNIGDTDLFNNAIINSYNFIDNIYSNDAIVVKSIFNRDYNTSKDERKMSYSDIFFNLLNYSTNDNLQNFIKILGSKNYADKIDQYNIVQESYINYI